MNGMKRIFFFKVIITTWQIQFSAMTEVHREGLRMVGVKIRV